ncbi:Putative transposable element [Caligus rogercresseyi]|uniref:Transposable element n=1 Tax=Caligus rogercresseyi TaxID=217165 RepID=A0A7T8KJZ2_CALRO|nr:Putative transposable element [Caligus rogercresseyi]
METVVLPCLKANYPKGNYVFQRDSTPRHKAKKTQKWWKDILLIFVLGECCLHPHQTAILLTMGYGAPLRGRPVPPLMQMWMS